MAIHNKSHHNSALMSILRSNKENIKNQSSIDFPRPEKSVVLLDIDDCMNALKKLPDESVQLILIDPPYNLELANWDTYSNYMEWAKNCGTHASGYFLWKICNRLCEKIGRLFFFKFYHFP